ncbi:hypothetical protein HAX54_002858 [Datura stramonium]|uniref:SWIM-type domain-containing protein n=1 Tax=Datura stramonium TaxID=4076 RepID=A0ABS8WRM3_DATST|nr:hypothetical protein [Datura stramonium]
MCLSIPQVDGLQIRSPRLRKSNWWGWSRLLTCWLSWCTTVTRLWACWPCHLAYVWEEINMQRMHKDNKVLSAVGVRMAPHIAPVWQVRAKTWQGKEVCDDSMGQWPRQADAMRHPCRKGRKFLARRFGAVPSRWPPCGHSSAHSMLEKPCRHMARAVALLGMFNRSGLV